MSLRLELTDNPSAAELAAVGGGLTAFNDNDVGPAERNPLAILVRGDGDTVQGGLSGYTAWGWLYVQWLWLAEDLRGQGLAARLLAMADSEAIKRGCHGAYIDSFSPTAIDVYQRAGYVEFGRLNDFPPGRTRVFLQKAL
ncbi:GNAT family N-acetyltransferase [Devosia sp. 2618]|uniref:GNAT family N-acetyltransferase n=1 Tax=Devosia sp. 2618 TaxID=3156454 RepID=UPI003397CD79